MSLSKFWSEICVNMLVAKPDAYVQIRKMFQHLSFSIPWRQFQKDKLLSFPQMGYKNDKSKMKQLERVYFNEEELTRIRDTFISRINSSGNKSIQTCVSAVMGNKKKDSRSQGFCMQTLTINYLDDGDKPVLWLELNYRSTEVTQKFLADLVFLRERIFPFIMEGWPEGLEPDGVRFNFSTCYISLMFMPVLFQATGLLTLLLDIQERDPKYYKMVISALGRLMDEDCTYSYRTRVNMHNLFRREVYPKLKTVQKKAIKKLLKEAGK